MDDQYLTCFNGCEDKCKSEGNGYSFFEMKCDTDCLAKQALGRFHEYLMQKTKKKNKKAEAQTPHSCLAFSQQDLKNCSCQPLLYAAIDTVHDRHVTLTLVFMHAFHFPFSSLPCSFYPQLYNMQSAISIPCSFDSTIFCLWWQIWL